jgi:hypothetical protein
MTRERIDEWLKERGMSTLLADGLDEAFLGVEENDGVVRAVYSIEECIRILSKDMDPAEAEEYFWYNTAGAYVGEQTPLFIHTP